MPLTFSCPSCGKDYDVPWSMAGKRARCKRCAIEFSIPESYEPVSPRTSEAIPVPGGPVPPRPSPTPPAVMADPPRAPGADWSRREGPPPARRVRQPGGPQPAPEPSGRPAWLIPAIAAGGVALIVLLNIGLYAAFVGRGGGAKGADPADAAPAGLVPIGALARGPADDAPAEADRVAAPVDRLEPVARRAEPEARAPAPVAREVDSDRVMSTADIVAMYEPSVALIKGKKGSGTGFVARPGIVATNSHVIEGERVKDLEIRFPSAPRSKQGPYPAKLLYQDKDRDLAMLGVATDLPPVRLADGYRFRKGEDVTVIGNPGLGGKLILENAISRGIVSSMTNLNEHSFLQLSIAINPGNSGGPVFDPRGRVIGVVTLKTVAQEGLAFAVPSVDLLSALGTAESIAARAPGEAKSSAPSLAYAFRLGQTYVYGLDVDVDTGNGRLNFAGSSIYRVKAVDADGITLAHKGWLTATRKGKDGKVLPGGVTGPTMAAEVELKLDDKGFVLKASGTSPLPLLLGDFAMLMIEPLPDDATDSWDDSQAMTLREVEQTPGGGGVGPNLGRPGLDSMPRGLQSRTNSRSRPNSRIGRPPTPPAPRAQPQPQVRVKLHEAAEETSYTLGAASGDRAPIRKVYELTTREMIGNEPRLKLAGDGTITFDVKAGIPLAMNCRYRLVEIAPGATLRIPITISCKLLDGKEREKALLPPANPPASTN